MDRLWARVANPFSLVVDLVAQRLGASEASRDRLAISSGRLYGAIEARHLNTAMVEAYRSGGYTLQEVVEYFGLALRIGKQDCVWEYKI